jgi:hypothetical protein
MKIQIVTLMLPHASSRYWLNLNEKNIIAKLPKKYKDFEFNHTDYGLLLYGLFCKLVPRRGRPRKLWHLGIDIDLGNFTNNSMQKLNWISRDMLDIMYEQRDTFRFWDEGPD